MVKQLSVEFLQDALFFALMWALIILILGAAPI